MFWLEERHTLIFRPASSICFSLLLPPLPPPFNVTFHTILNLLPLLLVLCYSGYICTSSLLWSMSFHGLQSTAQHRAVPGLLLAFLLYPMHPLSTGLEASLLLLPMGLLSTGRLDQPQVLSCSL